MICLIDFLFGSHFMEQSGHRIFASHKLIKDQSCFNLFCSDKPSDYQPSFNQYSPIIHYRGDSDRDSASLNKTVCTFFDTHVSFLNLNAFAVTLYPQRMAQQKELQQQDGNTFEYGGKRWTKLEFITHQSQKPEIEFLPNEVPFESVALYRYVSICLYSNMEYFKKFERTHWRCSFMRCGNIMLRNYIEKISGFYTGYDLADHPEFDVKGTHKTPTQTPEAQSAPKVCILLRSWLLLVDKYE